MNINNNIKTHLEYVGYAMVPNEDNEIHIFMKPGMPTIYMQQLTNNRLVLNCIYEYNRNGDNNRTRLLEYVNHLNVYSYVSTFTVDSGKLGFCALFSGIYDRIEFGQFMQAFEHDATALLDNNPDTKLFLMEDCPEIDSELMNLEFDKQYAA
tara:strand:+ start:162 stop:617 length:456 start_codon:yes stop_codon:yes gene_type:complete